jgi:glycosyltransferase involved in cell wall biosynthesis
MTSPSGRWSVGPELLLEALGINERIHWLGYIADRAVYMEALASCDLFVFPSPAEGFPKVILDAMAAGLPVVAAPKGSSGSWVRRGSSPLRDQPPIRFPRRAIASPSSQTGVARSETVGGPVREAGEDCPQARTASR